MIKNERLRNEIKERMKIMGVDSAFVKNALNGDVPIFERQNRIFTDVHYSLELNKGNGHYIDIALKVEELKLRYNLHTYMAQITHTYDGTLCSLFFIELNDEDASAWQNEKANLKDNYAYVYMMNLEEPLFSEFGDISFVKGHMGGIVRVA